MRGAGVEPCGRLSVEGVDVLSIRNCFERSSIVRTACDHRVASNRVGPHIRGVRSVLRLALRQNVDHEAQRDCPRRCDAVLVQRQTLRVCDLKGRGHGAIGGDLSGEYRHLKAGSDKSDELSIGVVSLIVNCGSRSDRADQRYRTKDEAESADHTKPCRKFELHCLTPEFAYKGQLAKLAWGT